MYFLSETTNNKLNSQTEYLLKIYHDVFKEMNKRKFFIEEIKSCVRKKDVNVAIMEKLRSLNSEEFNRVNFKLHFPKIDIWNVKTALYNQMLGIFNVKDEPNSRSIIDFIYDENFTTKMLDGTEDFSWLNNLHDEEKVRITEEYSKVCIYKLVMPKIFEDLNHAIQQDLKNGELNIQEKYVELLERIENGYLPFNDSTIDLDLKPALVKHFNEFLSIKSESFNTNVYLTLIQKFGFSFNSLYEKMIAIALSVHFLTILKQNYCQHEVKINLSTEYIQEQINLYIKDGRNTECLFNNYVFCISRDKFYLSYDVKSAYEFLLETF